MRRQAQWSETLRSNVVVVTALATNRMVYTQLAVSAGRHVEVHAFVETDAAVRWLDRHCANLVISDDHVSGLDGIDIVRRLTERGASGRIPVVVVTPYRDSGLQRCFLEAGATDVWPSPLDILGCRTRIRNLLRLASDTSQRDTGKPAPKE